MAMIPINLDHRDGLNENLIKAIAFDTISGIGRTAYLSALQEDKDNYRKFTLGQIYGIVGLTEKFLESMLGDQDAN